ncbi:hypothetical protein [Neobacillus sp. PS3-40]|uniref:hypothetical protein n=1 Tax=Neobacillus sp. PS3-40 TaxID=3070679 RepID=UPI0027DECC68|nr:hypothetical protein [Neobacillus sp. PS3-40]WML44074.1 hypothetical protein RCG20_20210 [Neobacillus sp. PS3-40]
MNENIRVHLSYPVDSKYAETFIEMPMMEALLILQTGNLYMWDLKNEDDEKPDYIIDKAKYYFSEEKEEKELYISLEFEK